MFTEHKTMSQVTNLALFFGHFVNESGLASSSLVSSSMCSQGEPLSSMFL